MARLPYRTPEELEGDHDLLTSSMDAEDLPEEYQHLYSTNVRHVHRTIANNPDILEAFRTYNGAVWHDSGLGDRERELVILSIAGEVPSRYEWHQHVRHGLAVGLSEAEIVAAGAGDADAFEGSESALVAYAHAFARGEVDDALHEALAEYADDATIVGAGALAAAYLGLAHLLDALNVEPEEEFVGFELENL